MTIGSPREYTPVVCRDFAREFDPELINRPSDLVNGCRLLCVRGGDSVSSLCVSPGLFYPLITGLVRSGDIGGHTCSL